LAGKSYVVPNNDNKTKLIPKML